VRVFALILWTLTIVVAQYAGAVTTSTRGNISATDPFGIDAFEYERALVMLDAQLLFQVRGLPAYPAP
jgi:hypothetical protein